MEGAFRRNTAAVARRLERKGLRSRHRFRSKSNPEQVRTARRATMATTDDDDDDDDGGGIDVDFAVRFLLSHSQQSTDRSIRCEFVMGSLTGLAWPGRLDDSRSKSFLVERPTALLKTCSSRHRDRPSVVFRRRPAIGVVDKRNAIDRILTLKEE